MKMHTTVADYMTPLAYTIGDDQNLADAAFRMKELNVRHLPVMRGSRLVGIVSQRDIAVLKATSSNSLDELSAAEAMTPEPFTVAPDDPLSEAARIMSERRYGAVLVMKGDELVGIFTSTDGLRALAEFSA